MSRIIMGKVQAARVLSLFRNFKKHQCCATVSRAAFIHSCSRPMREGLIPPHAHGSPTSSSYGKHQSPWQLVPGCRFFFHLPKPFATSLEEKQHSEQKIVGYSVNQVYSVVVAVEHYHEFVPWFQKSEVICRKPGQFKAQVEIGYPPVLEICTPLITFVKPHLVEAYCTDGKLLNHLQVTWRLGPGLPNNPRTCTVQFKMAFMFRTPFYSHLADAFYDDVARKMMDAYLERARTLYGPQSSVPHSSAIVTS